MRITVIAPLPAPLPAPFPAPPSHRLELAMVAPPTDAPGGSTPVSFDLEITINHSDATWRDLWHGVARTLDTGDIDDGITHVGFEERILALDACIDRTRLVPGSVVSFITGPAREQPSDGDPVPPRIVADHRGPARRLRVVGGLDAGLTIPLGAGAHMVGRDPSCGIVLTSPTVSRTHARLVVSPDGATTVTDLGATNGVRAGGAFVRTAPVPVGRVLTLGATSMVLEDLPTPSPTTAGATDAGPRPHHRPPRVRAPAPDTVVRVPVESRSIAGRTPFSWAMLLAPLAIGALMALLFSPMFAVFAVLSPVMMVASWLEQRRRGSRERRRQGRAFTERLGQFCRELDAAARAHEGWLERSAPDLAAVVERAVRQDPRLWERRPDHADFGLLRVGRSSRPWSPKLDRHLDHALDPDAVAPACREAIVTHARLHDAPLVIEVGPRCVVGISGPVEVGRALARALVVQAAVHHGPADLWTALATTDDCAESWAALSWLPHHASSPEPDSTTCATTETAVRQLAHVLRARSESTGGGCGLVVVDATGPTSATTPSAASFHTLCDAAATGHAAIVLVADPHLLPASCTTVVECLDEDGSARLTVPATGARSDTVALDGMCAANALDVARRLARFSDPLARRGAASLPRSVTFHEALAAEAALVPSPAVPGSTPGASRFPTLDAPEIVRRWARHRDGAGLPAIVGLDADGPHIIDLVTDGPHALVGGTTGSGKSELLRTWVLALACTHAPDALTFVLIDYKGGSAFDGCAELPHVVGVVTDLDDQLASRALRSLEAEIRHREQRLRDAGVADVAALRRSSSAAAPLPRLVVIIDEFATLATDVPGFLDALVSIAQRGRSLGVHLVLATQRPHGAVNDNIRTNANLRIALRLLDASDSVDIIGTRDATAIDRRVPGRVCSTTGSEPPAFWQAAHLRDVVDASGIVTATGPHPRAAISCVRLDAFGRAAAGPVSQPVVPAAAERGHPTPADATLDPLGLLVAHIGGAFRASGLPQPRRPWLPPLSTSLPVHVLRTAIGGDLRGGDGSAPLAAIPLGLTDEPDIPRQRAWSWAPSAGPLVIYGMPGSGKSTALRLVIDGLARAHRVDACHVYVIAAASAELAPLQRQPQVGAMINPDERARLTRLLRWLEHQRHTRATAPVSCRGSSPGSGSAVASDPEPAIVVLVDDAAVLTHVLDDLDGRRLLASFLRLATDGPRLGLHLVLTGDRPQAIPASVAAATDAKVVLRLPDPYDYSLLGIRAPGAPPGPGRGVLADGTEIQLGLVSEPSAPRPAHPDRAGGAQLPVPIGELPAAIALRDLPPASADRDTWMLPIGLDDATLATATLALAAGDHVLLAGPAGSGRTTALLTLGCAFEYAALGHVVVLSPRANALSAAFVDHATSATRLFEQLARRVGEARAQHHSSGRVLVLIDDGDLLDDERLQRLVTSDDPAVRVVVAGRSDRLRRGYTHWTRPLRDSRFGLALEAAATNDGDLWNVRIPDHPESGSTGRAAMIHDGHVDIVQIAHP